MKNLYILFLMIFTSSAFAVTWSQNSDFLWSTSTGKIDVFPGTGTGQVWSINDVKPSATGPTVSRPKALPFSPSPTANFKASFTPASIAKGLLNPASAAITLVGAALINSALENACIRAFGGTMSIAPGGQWEECKFKDVAVDSYRASSGAGSTPMAACENLVSKNQSTANGFPWHFSSPHLDADSTHCLYNQQQMYCAPIGCTPISTLQDSSVLITKTSVTQKVQDGYQPATNAKAQSLLEPIIQDWSQADFSYGREGSSSVTGKLLDELLKSGNPVDVDGISGSGPASSDPVTTTKTTTGADGKTTTETSTTTNHYTYDQKNPTTVTVTNVSTTTVSSVDNSTGAVTNTTTTTQPAPTKEDQKTDCEKNPEAIGCQKIDFDTPDDKIPTVSKEVKFTPDDLGFGGGSCPADVMFTPHGMQQSLKVIDWVDSCDKIVTYAKPLILALAGFSALMIIFVGGKPE